LPDDFLVPFLKLLYTWLQLDPTEYFLLGSDRSAASHPDTDHSTFPKNTSSETDAGDEVFRLCVRDFVEG
jgi:hypothetical protein